jgi:hypothetical protein
MKTRRNEPCHSGSGKKFKRCCGVPPQVPRSMGSPSAGIILSFYQPFAAHGISPDVAEAMKRELPVSRRWLRFHGRASRPAYRSASTRKTRTIVHLNPYWSTFAP